MFDRVTINNETNLFISLFTNTNSLFYLPSVDTYSYNSIYRKICIAIALFDFICSVSIYNKFQFKTIVRAGNSLQVDGITTARDISLLFHQLILTKLLSFLLLICIFLFFTEKQHLYSMLMKILQNLQNKTVFSVTYYL